MIKFAKRFKKERLTRKLTQKELANRFNTSKSNISRYENGICTPGIKTIIEYANFFDVSIDYLLGRIDVKNYHKLPEELWTLLNEDNFKYLKIARKLKKNNISQEAINTFLSLAKVLKSETEY